MSLPVDHDQRLIRARLSLDGLSVGDSFGGRFYRAPHGNRELPASPWNYSDDTAMAVVLFQMLEQLGRIDRDLLAKQFAACYQADPFRGYGQSVRGVLDSISDGIHWREAATQIYGGNGSMGNGGAMRVAPLGAYFAGDFDQVVDQARASAEVTHAHPEGQAGAIAIAVAAAYASTGEPESARKMLNLAHDLTPDGPTREGIAKAQDLGFGSSIVEAVKLLGNGQRITSPDTVPFALWCASRHLDSYSEALWTVVEAEGDNDTNAAIVGSIVCLATGSGSIPEEWLAAREVLPLR